MRYNKNASNRSTLSEQLQWYDDRQLKALAFVEYRSSSEEKGELLRRGCGVQSTDGRVAGGKQQNAVSPGLFFAVHETHSFLLHIFPAKVASLVELNLFSIPWEHEVAIGGSAHHMEQEVFDPAILVLNIQEEKIQWLHWTNCKGEGTIHMKTRGVHFAWKTYESKVQAWYSHELGFIILII